MPRHVPRRFTHASVVPPDPDLVLFDPGKTENGHIRRSAAAELDFGDQLRRPRVPFDPIRPILDQRPRLELQLFRSEPLDRDPSAQIQRYRFAVAVLHKSPSVFLESTRRPVTFKNISR